MSCAFIVRVGGSEEGDENEPEPDLSFIEAHTAFMYGNSHVHNAGWLVQVHSQGCMCKHFMQVTTCFKVQTVNISHELFLILA
jgi:hypothetical protein